MSSPTSASVPDPNSLSAAYLNMRGRLREEHEKILQELQDGAAEKIDRELNQRLQSLQLQMENRKTAAISDVFLAFQHCIADLCQRDEYSGIGSAILQDNETLSELPSTYDTVRLKELNVAATRVLDTGTEFFIEQEDSALAAADEPLMKVEVSVSCGT